MMKNRIFRHITVWALMAAILLTTVILPFPALSSGEGKARITREGEAITALTLVENEKITLTAAHNLSGEVEYCWQIMDKNLEDRWIGITGIHSDKLAVSYALIGSMLRADGTAMLRCKLTAGGAEYLTDPVKVTVSFVV